MANEWQSPVGGGTQSTTTQSDFPSEGGGTFDESQAYALADEIGSEDWFTQQQIYIGPSTVSVLPGGRTDHGQVAPRPGSPVHGETSYLDAVDWINDLRARDYKTWLKYSNALRAAGYLGEDSTSPNAVADAWRLVVQEAARIYSNGEGDAITPSELLASRVEEADRMRKEGALPGAEYSGPTTTSSTNQNVSVDLANITEAKGLYTEALKAAIGRAPTDEEVAKFHSVLVAQQKANPNVSTSSSSQTVTPGDGQGDGGSSSSRTSTTSKGGVDAAQVAVDYAKSQEGYAEHQAATGYLDAFMQTMRGQVL